ncbi:MAG: DUF3127 domain-containing protein [Bacteroidales bacterium]|nr:DUF3127 domain-containing protein [Bacteroidales bacterium]
MEITGKLIKLLPEVSGTSARGEWVRGGFVIETEGEYPRQVAFTAFGADKVAMVKNIPMGSSIVVSFSPESREYNERWYTDLRCRNIQPYVPGQMPAAATGYSWAGAPAAAAPAPQQPGQPAFAAPVPPQQPVAPANQMPNEGEDDLPF